MTLSRTRRVLGMICIGFMGLGAFMTTSIAQSFGDWKTILIIGGLLGFIGLGSCVFVVFGKAKFLGESDLR